MRWRWAALAAVAGLAWSAGGARAGDYTEPRPIRAEGDRLVDALGREVILRGVNHIGLRSDRLHPLRSSVGDAYDPALFFELGDLDDDDFEQIARLGFNSIRLVVTWEFAEPEVGSWDAESATYTGHYDATYFALIDDFIARAFDHGMSVVFDFGQFGWSRFLGGNAGAPDWAVSETCRSLPGPVEGAPPQASGSVGCAYYNFWTNSASTGFPLQEAYAALWKHVAARYAGDPAVSMYDLQNEPVAGPIPEGVFQYQYLYPFYRKLAAAIRQVDADHPIAFQPVITHSLGVPSPFVEPIGIANAVYLPHNYTAAYFPQRIDPSFTPFQPPLTLADLAATRVEALGFGTPVAIGETGWTRSTHADGVGGPVEDTDPAAPPAFARDLGQAADLLQLGWHWFAWSAIDEAYGVNHGGEVDAELARALARPFPRATAGRLASFSFDPDTRVYVQETVDAIDGVASEIALPLEWTYPEGARVTRDGALAALVLGDGSAFGEASYLSGSRTLVLPSVAGRVEIAPLPEPRGLPALLAGIAALAGLRGRRGRRRPAVTSSLAAPRAVQ